MFTWKIPTPPATHRYSAAAGAREIAVVTISTDEGIEGHAFLGASNRGADIDVQAILTYLKPMLMGRKPGRGVGGLGEMRCSAGSGRHLLRAIEALDVALSGIWPGIL